MRILLTGATGFVGQPLCEELARRGHTLVVLSRNAARARRALPVAERCHDWDPMVGPPPPEAFAGVDGVINLAGESVQGRWTDEKKARIRDSRVVGTRHLVEGIRQLEDRPGALVSASAVGYYGERGEDPLPESEPASSAFLGQVGAEWEREALVAEGLGVRVALPRISVVLHPSGGALGGMLLPAKLGLLGPIAGGRQWWPWIHRDDLVSLLCFALEEPVSGPLNAAAPEPVRQADFQRELGRVLGRPAFLPAPGWALRLALGEFAVELLRSAKVVPERTLAAGFEFAHPRLQGALRDLLGS